MIDEFNAGDFMSYTPGDEANITEAEALEALSLLSDSLDMGKYRGRTKESGVPAIATTTKVAAYLLQVEPLKGVVGMLERQLAEARETNESTYCAYCAERFPVINPDPEALDAVGEHIRTCPKHPMRELERQLLECRTVLREQGEGGMITGDPRTRKGD